MLVKDKDILVEDPEKKDGDNAKNSPAPQKPQRPKIKKENMRAAWGDAFDYYIRGITEKYLMFRGRASRLEFWGFAVAAGIMWIPLYFVGEYAEMPLLPYYFSLATLLPTVAVTARRLHDINKNAALYLIPGAVLAASGFFIGLAGAAVLVLCWAILLIRLLSRETDLSDGFYGAPNDNDEVYGEDNLPIVRKFRFLALTLLAVWLAITGAKLEDWSQQAQQKAAIDLIMDKVLIEGQDAKLTPEQIKAAQGQMLGVLKTLSGQRVSEKEIMEQVDKAVKAVSDAAQVSSGAAAAGK